MTSEQYAALNTLRRRRYSVSVRRHVRGGIYLIRIQCRLLDGYMTLRLYPDGTYLPPHYASHGNRDRR